MDGTRECDEESGGVDGRARVLAGVRRIREAAGRSFLRHHNRLGNCQPSHGRSTGPKLVAPPTARTPYPNTPSAPPSALLIKVSHVSQLIRADLFDQIRIISSVQNPMALSSNP